MEKKVDIFLIPVFKASIGSKKQFPSAPGKACEIQLVEKPTWQSQPTVSTEFCIYAGNRMGEA